MFGRKKRLTNEELRELFEEIGEIFEEQQKRIEALEAAVEVHNEMRTDEIRALRAMVEALEAKVAELEAKRVPVISDLTGGGNKEKPVTAKQIMDEWFNGKAEGGEGK